VDTYLAIASRRDERRYAPEPLPAEVVERILDAGRLAGSAGNRQPWTFAVAVGRERIDRLAEGVFVPENVRSAALAVAVLVTGKGPTSFDAGRAAQNMLLAAWNEGVSSCPNGVKDPEALAAAIDAGEGERPVIVLTFGVPGRPRDPESLPAAAWSARANRKPLGNVVRRLA
jgi:nitroreductase